jgi:hypothetical protein
MSTIDLGVEGRVSVSPTAHKMSADIEFPGEDGTVYASQGDPSNWG